MSNNSNLLKDLVRLFFRKKFRANLIPSNEIISQKNNFEWESLGNDPQFVVSGNGFPSGWIQISWSGCSDGIRYLRLYIDHGSGFSEETAVDIGFIAGENIIVQKTMLHLGNSIKGLRIDPGNNPGMFTLNQVTFINISRIEVAIKVLSSFLERKNMTIPTFTKKVFLKIQSEGIGGLWNKVKELTFNRNLINYNQYLDNRRYVISEDSNEQTNFIKEKLTYKPLISILLPISKVNENWLNKSLESIVGQSYDNWQLVIVDADGNYGNLSIIKRSNVKYIHAPTDNMVDAVNTGLELLDGEYITILEQEDELSINALLHVVNTLNVNRNIDIIYSDEDRVNEEGEYFAPFYKEIYSKEDSSFVKMIQNLGVYKKELTLTLDSSNTTCEFYNQLLTNAKVIKHIPKVLYHKRTVPSEWYKKSDDEVKLIAFYLPQFHPFPENDLWWGKGFTEWTNVTRGKPMFPGHYQPHLPADLGFYDLRVPEVKEQQAELAKEYGVYGFCYYYYWFNGKRLLERPLNDILSSGKPDHPFCICWANESWTRRWDGAEKEVLMLQEHNPETDQKFIDDVIPLLKDKRYIKINEEPILLIYRINLFPDPIQTIEMWRKRCSEAGIPKIHVCAVQSFGINDPRTYGCDSAVEFPPHGVNVAEISSTIEGLNPDFEGNIYDYEEVVDRALLKARPDYSLYRGVMLGWDNTARRNLSSNIFHNASPSEYNKWLTGVIDYSKRFHGKENKFVFINAWNEWAEGTHLEPDQKNGHDYLKATKKAIDSK
ncbi:glycoside hydrolase family 99-like domain-containing protein [Paenibacillus elgii]|uniref:glycoside hydrolase family 99-like domain-containing protein n=1 Tax=Paenibacillus elgii TaxID=189691 RepID=UPI0013D21B90|nr:glycoside hydrolase family 99-like domain-containing protein [Paenibacillus elgii]